MPELEDLVLKFYLVQINRLSELLEMQFQVKKGKYPCCNFDGGPTVILAVVSDCHFTIATQFPKQVVAHNAEHNSPSECGKPKRRKQISNYPHITIWVGDSSFAENRHQSTLRNSANFEYYFLSTVT